MKKKAYIKPAQRMMAINMCEMLTESVTDTNGNSGIGYGGGGDEPARAHEYDMRYDSDWGGNVWKGGVWNE